MPPSLADIVQEHRRQFETEPMAPAPSLLRQGLLLLQQHLQSLSLDAEVVHQGEYLYFHLGDKEAAVALLTRYLSQRLSPEEEAWARWNLTDYLAMLRRCDEAVLTQWAFLTWAGQALPLDRLLWVMYDGTQALCWWQTGQAETWLNIFQEIMRRVPATAENRFERHLYLRTAGMLLCRLNRPGEALTIAEQMRALTQEAPKWERSPEVQAEAYALQVTSYHALKDEDALREAGILASELLLQGCGTATAFQRQRLAVMCNNVAAALYQARQYDLSIPLHQQAIALGTSSEHSYLWLAASLWATTQDRSQVLALLHQGAVLHRGSGFNFQGIPEFADVEDDVEFIAAISSA